MATRLPAISPFTMTDLGDTLRSLPDCKIRIVREYIPHPDSDDCIGTCDFEKREFTFSTRGSKRDLIEWAFAWGVAFGKHSLASDIVGKK